MKELLYVSKYGRRRRIRTAIQAPKASVLAITLRPLYYGAKR